MTATNRALEFVPPGYEVLGEVGRGGMGIVLKAKELESGDIVALKILPRERGTSDVLQDRFALESELGNFLHHADIVEIYDAGKTDKFLWIAMELLDGADLGKAIADPTFTFADRIRVLIRASLALQHAHERGVIHRDVKPSNIFLTKSGDVKLLDFGVAKVGSKKLTESGNIVGTPGYMSPEQIMSQGVTSQTDVFALGVVAYEMLTGKMPWTADTQHALLMAICVSPPRPFKDNVPPNNLEPAKLEAMHRVIHKALDGEPTRRQASAFAFAEELENVLYARSNHTVDLTKEITGRWSEQRIEWARARAAQIESAKTPEELSAALAVAVDAEEKERGRSRLWTVLVAAFAAAIGVVSYLLLAGE